MDVETFILVRKDMYTSQVAYGISMIANILLLPALIPAVILTICVSHGLAKFRKDIRPDHTKAPAKNWNKFNRQ